MEQLHQASLSRDVRAKAHDAFAADYVLRGSTRGRTGAVVVLGLLVVVVGLFVLVLQTMVAEGEVLGLGIATMVLTAVLGAIFYALRAGRAALVIQPERALLDSRPEGTGGRLIELRYADLRSVALSSRGIVFRTGGDSVLFRGERLHIEDAFDVLAARVEAANPACMVVNRP